MAKILVFQHVPYEILGTFNPLLKKAGFRIRYVNFGRNPDEKPNLDGYDGLVILGGPMNLDQTKKHPHLKTEMNAIEVALKQNMPILGICLGAQLLAKTLGATIKPNPKPEIGWYDVTPTAEGKKDSLIREFNQTECIFQWHEQTFELPKGAIHLAESESCKHQAFSYNKNVYGFQFHLEVDEALVSRWLNVPIYRSQLRAFGFDADAIRKKTNEVCPQSKKLSKRTFGKFIDLFGEKKKYVRLSSAH